MPSSNRAIGDLNDLPENPHPAGNTALSSGIIRPLAEATLPARKFAVLRANLPSRAQIFRAAHYGAAPRTILPRCAQGFGPARKRNLLRAISSSRAQE